MNASRRRPRRTLRAVAAVVLAVPAVSALEARLLRAGETMNPWHYGNPQSGEASVDLLPLGLGVPGSVCTPPCGAGQSCPLDIPAGVTAIGACVLQLNGENFATNCVLVCVERPPTPLPVLKVATIALVQVLNTASYLMTFPFIPMMLMSFDAALRPESVGFYSGILEAAFHVGATAGSLFWGWYSDAYGRRPALLLGLAGTIVSALAFGLSESFGAAILARFAWGLLNGNVGVAKTTLTELCDDTNVARAFSYIGLNTGVGRIIGPAVGGLLADPVRRFPAVFGSSSIFARFRFLLPCLVAAGMTAACLVLAFFVLEETRHVSLADAARESREGAAAAAAAAAGRRRAPAAGADRGDDKDGGDADEESAPLRGGGKSRRAGADGLGADVDELADEDVEADVAPGQTPRAARAPAPAPAPAPPRATVRGALVAGARDVSRLLADPPVASAVGVYACLGFVGLISNELFPLYVINDAAHGGFSWSAAQIGTVGFASGPFLVVFQAFLYDPLVRALGGVVALLRASLALFAVLLALTPWQSAALALPPAAQDAVLYVHSIAINLARVTAFICVFIVVTNSASPADRGRVNGLGQAAVSVVRSAGPPLGTALFAASVSDVGVALGWPFNHHLTWYILALATLGTLALTYRLPPWIAGRRKPGQN